MTQVSNEHTIKRSNNKNSNSNVILYQTAIQRQEEREREIKSLDKSLRKLLPDDVVTKHIYTSTKLSSKFKIKDKTKQQNKYDLTYYVECPECSDYYVGEIHRRLYERNCDCGGKDKR